MYFPTSALNQPTSSILFLAASVFPLGRLSGHDLDNTIPALISHILLLYIIGLLLLNIVEPEHKNIHRSTGDQLRRAKSLKEVRGSSNNIYNDCVN